MKKHMDPNTIVYVGKDFSLGYDFSLLKTNPDIIDKKIKYATHIFFKVNKSINSWIDYRKAIENNSGDHAERLEKALKNPNMILSHDLVEIPTTIYTDIYGDQYQIEPNDGKKLDKFWCERVDYFMDKPEISIFKRQLNRAPNDHIDLPIYEVDVLATFKQDISDCIFTLNSLYLEYDLLSNTEVLFRNVKSWCANITPLDTMVDQDNYEFEVEVHKWDKISTGKKLRPVHINKHILTFEEPVNEHGLLTYNGLLYNYFLIKENDTDTKSKTISLDLNEFSFEIIDELRLRKFQLITMDMKNPVENMTVKKFTLTGLNNIYPNEVEFSKKVRNAMIVCNHLNFSYHLQDAYTVKFPVGINGVCEGLDDDTPVKAIYFFIGSEVYNSAGYVEDTDEIEIEEVEDSMIKRDYERYLNDYQDSIKFNDSVISLYSKYKPLNGNIRLFINGVRYDKDIHFKYDDHSKAIMWTFTTEYGGFELKPEFSYTAVYDLSFYENNILDVKSFIRDYKTELKRKALGF